VVRAVCRTLRLHPTHSAAHGLLQSQTTTCAGNDPQLWLYCISRLWTVEGPDRSDFRGHMSGKEANGTRNAVKGIPRQVDATRALDDSLLNSWPRVVFDAAIVP